MKLLKWLFGTTPRSLLLGFALGNTFSYLYDYNTIKLALVFTSVTALILIRMYESKKDAETYNQAQIIEQNMAGVGVVAGVLAVCLCLFNYTVITVLENKANSPISSKINCTAFTVINARNILLEDKTIVPMTEGMAYKYIERESKNFPFSENLMYAEISGDYKIGTRKFKKWSTGLVEKEQCTSINGVVK